jgi:hypothetical protein
MKLKTVLFGVLFFLSQTSSFSFQFVSSAYARRTTVRAMAETSSNRCEGDSHVDNVLFIECGFGNDSHGQNVTKAAGMFQDEYIVCHVLTCKK